MNLLKRIIRFCFPIPHEWTEVKMLEFIGGERVFVCKCKKCGVGASWFEGYFQCEKRSCVEPEEGEV